jgi:hypothetical protein
VLLFGSKKVHDFGYQKYLEANETVHRFKHFTYNARSKVSLVAIPFSDVISLWKESSVDYEPLS